MKNIRVIALESYKKQVREKTEELKEVLTEDIEKGTLKDRMACIWFCMGYMESAGYDFVPCEILEYISELYYAGKIKA